MRPASRAGGPQLITTPAVGRHHEKPRVTRQRLKKARPYDDLSTVCVIPTRGTVAIEVVQTWMDLLPPMNQPFVKWTVKNAEVGDAYNAAVEQILLQLPHFKYLLTLEEDNMPPPDGAIKLLETIANSDYAAVGGLYYTKGEGGMPMIYGNPRKLLGFEPQLPQMDKVQECNGLGMGFTLFRLDVFRDERIPRPWFKTMNEWTPQEGGKVGTQDLYFFANARKAGWKVASDNRVKVGHYDAATGLVW